MFRDRSPIYGPFSTALFLMLDYLTHKYVSDRFVRGLSLSWLRGKDPNMNKGLWIPEAILRDVKLTSAEKLILSLVISLDQSEEGCWAGNQYLADVCGCSKSTVSNSVSRLIKMNYLRRTRFDGRRRYLKCCLPNLKRQSGKKAIAASPQGEPDNKTHNNTNKNKSSVARKNAGDGFFGALGHFPVSDKELMKELAGRNGNLV